MITPIKEFLSEGHPSIDDICECLEVANTENCVVHLKWFIPYNGWNDRYIRPGERADKIVDALPKIYGV